MHHVALFIGRLRQRVRPFVPARWLEPSPLSPHGLRPQRPANADMEIEPESPASSWVAWEVTPRRRRG